MHRMAVRNWILPELGIEQRREIPEAALFVREKSPSLLRPSPPSFADLLLPRSADPDNHVR